MNKKLRFRVIDLEGNHIGYGICKKDNAVPTYAVIETFPLIHRYFYFVNNGMLESQDNYFQEINHNPHVEVYEIDFEPLGTSGKIEVWDFIADQQLDYFRGNIVEYTCRAGKKANELEDLKKAQAYLNKLISIVEAKRALE